MLPLPQTTQTRSWGAFLLAPQFAHLDAQGADGALDRRHYVRRARLVTNSAVKLLDL
jgi:hypothetical protein